MQTRASMLGLMQSHPAYTETFFHKWTFKDARSVAIKLGGDSDVDPDTGETTFADALCSITEIRVSLVYGDEVCETPYNLSHRQIVHHDADPATYGARVKLGDEVITATARRVTLAGEEAYGILSGSAVILVPATSRAQTVQLEINQATTTTKLGEVIGGSNLASSSWEVELLNH